MKEGRETEVLFPVFEVGLYASLLLPCVATPIRTPGYLCKRRVCAMHDGYVERKRSTEKPLLSAVRKKEVEEVSERIRLSPRLSCLH